MMASEDKAIKIIKWFPAFLVIVVIILGIDYLSRHKQKLILNPLVVSKQQFSLSQQAMNIVKNYPQPGEGSIGHWIRLLTASAEYVDGTQPVGWRAYKDESDGEGYRVFYFFTAGDGTLNNYQWEVDLETKRITAQNERAQKLLNIAEQSLAIK